MTSFQFGWRRLVGAGVIALATGCAALAQPAPLPPPTQTPAVPLTPAVKADPMVVPGFWDPRRRPERPDLSRREWADAGASHAAAYRAALRSRWLGAKPRGVDA